MKRVLLLISIFTSLSFVPAGIASAAYDPFQDTCSDPNAQQSEVCTNEGRSGSNPVSGSDSIFMKITNAIALVAGVAAVIIIIVAGFQFVASGGDSNKVSSARSTIIYAVIGLIVIALARTIIAFVINSV